MNKKGFTLTELIVCMAIFAVLSVVSYPAISSIVTKHREQQYEEYEKMMVRAAELYFEKSDATSVTLETLIAEKLISNVFSINGKIANKSASLVQVVTTTEAYYDEQTVLCPKLVIDNVCHSTVDNRVNNPCNSICG